MEDPSTFMGTFTQNDQETINIMAKAAKIVPQVCDILGISLSDSESDVEDDDDDNVALSHGERSPTVEADDGEEGGAMMIVDNNNHQVQQAHADADHGGLRKSRKRCESTPAGQSNPPNPKKRRRFPSNSISTSGPGSADPLEFAIRQKMMRDLETVERQLKQLAELERQQTSLIRRYIQITQAHQQEQTNNDTDRHNGTNDDTATVSANDEGIGQGITGQEILQNAQEQEFFTDAELQIAAEEVIGGAEEVGSLF